MFLISYLSPVCSHAQKIRSRCSFAEIGAGHEVARWFLVVGGAYGTVAKTISAYDKEVNDDLYGSGSRYVSKQRLEAMLDNEWAQLVTQRRLAGRGLGSFPLWIPSPRATSPEPTTLMVGSVSAFSRGKSRSPDF